MRIKDEKKYLAIVEASISLINDIGFAQTSMSKIAKKAGVSPSTIYVYFENKEDLLNKLYVFAKAKGADELLKGFILTMPIEEAFKLLWYNFFNYICYNKRYFSFTEQFYHSPLINNVNREKTEDLYKPAYEFVERGKREGIFKDIPLDIFVLQVFSPIKEFVKTGFLEGGEIDREKLAGLYKLAWDCVSM